VAERHGAALEVRGLIKQFGGVRALAECSVSVAAGRVTGLIGPNGAGKSTLIDVVTGFAAADAGTVRVFGRDISGWAPHRIARQGVLRTFQTPREWPGLTVMENMLIASPCDDRPLARSLLDELGLLSVRDEPAGCLSGGQKRALEFARVAIGCPRMIILDEPTESLNPLLGLRVEQAIRRMTGAGVTVLVVEHNLPFVERVCDSVIVMASGAVVASGPFASLRADAAVVDAYLGGAAGD
jgi:ABC-type branched-subunit amino acid transport system ATPase component